MIPQLCPLVFTQMNIYFHTKASTVKFIITAFFFHNHQTLKESKVSFRGELIEWWLSE